MTDGHESSSDPSEAPATEASTSQGLGSSASAVTLATASWMRRRGVRLAGWGAVMGLAVIVPVVARVVVEGQAELERAHEMETYGTFDDQVLHLGRAARWRLPIAGHDERALAQLMALGEAHEAVGPEGHARALAAYREARRALLATRAVTVADPDTLARANGRIAALMAAQERELGLDAAEDGDRELHHLTALSEMPPSDSWRSRFAALAFVGWIVAGGGFVLTGIDARGRLRVKQAARWGVLLLALLVLWIVASGP